MTDSKREETSRNEQPHGKQTGQPAKGGWGRRLGRRAALLGGVSALGLGLALSVPVWARHGGPGWHGDGEFVEFVLERKLRRIDATESQREQILAIAADTREAILTLRDAEASPHEAFVAQLVADPGNTPELESLRVAQIDRVDEGSRIVVSALARIAAVLTPEQREDLAAMHRERHERWHH